MSSADDLLMKAVWGKPEVMYDRRQPSGRRSSWRGGRREAAWAAIPARADKSTRRRRSPGKLLM